MNTKKFLIAFGVVYILLEITNYLFHGVLTDLELRAGSGEKNISSDGRDAR